MLLSKGVYPERREVNMHALSNTKLGVKLIGGFVIVALIGTLIGIIGVSKTALMNERATQMYESDLVGMRYADDGVAELLRVGRSLRNAALAPTEETRNEQLDQASKHMTELKTAIENAASRVHTDKGKAEVESLRVALAAYEPELAQLVKVIRGEKLGENVESTRLLFGSYATSMKKIDDELASFSQNKSEVAGLEATETTNLFRESRVLMLSLTALGVLVGIGLGVWLTRSVTEPLGNAVDIARTLAKGDLTVAVRVDRGDEIGQLLSAMSDMVNNLRRLVVDVRSGIESVSTASAEIAAGNQDLSSRTEEQASSLQQTAASMEQLTSNVQNSANNAQQASQYAQAASTAATRGGEVVGGVVNTMDEISTASRKIADIIGVIDGIAFQTNILALNAAVEAARAGEQGRGFAVVAGEVRSLAQRAAQAAREIKTLIGDSVGKVEAGSHQVNAAGVAMKEIVEQVSRVSDLINEISSASAEQSSGIGQVNDAVSQMDQVTQQNAALVEQSAAAATSLKHQAEALTTSISAFDIGHTATLRSASAGSSATRAPARTAAVSPKPAAAAARNERKSPASMAPVPASKDEAWEEF